MDFSDRIHRPWYLNLFITLGTLIMFWLTLRYMFNSAEPGAASPGQPIPSLPLIPPWFIILFFAIPSLAFTFFYQNIKINVKNDFLKINGMRRYQRIKIPLKDIISAEVSRCNYEYWDSLTMNENLKNSLPEKCQIFSILGYQGSGLIIKYKYEGVFSGKTVESLLIPTLNATWLSENLLLREAA
jgi:hypothetical protein